MRVLITGGRGMVGSNLATYLCNQTYEILAPSRLELDLNDYKALEAYLHTHAPDLIIHCAGKVGGIHANIQSPSDFLTENLSMGQNLVLAAKSVGIKKLLNLGSSCMYPKGREKLSEHDLLSGPLEPTNEGYAIAKIAIAKLCEYTAKESADFHYKTLVPCNLYGPNDNFDPEGSHLIPAIIYKVHQAIEENNGSIEIWGDGTVRREFMYVKDLCEFIANIIPDIENIPSLMNVGLGFDYTINEYYETACQVIGYKGHLQHNINKPVGMKRKLLDISQQTVWSKAPPTPLEEGIKATYEYYLSTLQ